MPPRPDAAQPSYRQAEFRETCVVCRDEAARRCVQCARPFCELHGPTSVDGRCADCGIELGRQRANVRSTKHGVSVLLGVMGVVGAGFLGPLAAVAGGVGIALAQGVGAGVERLRRRAFERKRRLDHDEAMIEDPELGRRSESPEERRKVGVARRSTARKPLNFKLHR